MARDQFWPPQQRVVVERTHQRPGKNLLERTLRPLPTAKGAKRAGRAGRDSAPLAMDEDAE